LRIAPVAELLGDAILAGYRFGGMLLRPLVPLVLSVRASRGKEDASRAGERYGEASLKRPEGRLVWVHAASVGETIAVLPLIARLTNAGFPVLLTTTTLTSASIAAAQLPEGAVHQFGPLDVATYLDRFLDHWRPFLGIFVESELWPTVIGRLEERAVPLVVVNGRMSYRSFRRWRRFGAAARAVFGRIGLVLARSGEDGDRFRELGAPKVEVSGNLKFDAPPLAAAPDEIVRLRSAIGGRPVWVAAATHEGEESVVAAAHRIIRNRHPGLLTILVPRHPARGDAIRSLLVGERLSVAQRSRGEAFSPDTDVYLADTLGELGLFYRVVPVAFIGGSLVPVGGHNPIEAVRLGAVVIHGPHVHNFSELFATLDRVAPPQPVTDAASLAGAADPLIADSAAAGALAEKSAAALQPLSGALDATMHALEPCLSGTKRWP
jgi:3-deoxy-D-manno-octulosonic-acid transferase